ncbi:hypothetical protein ACFZAI_26505 [Achromobacter sp. NPDC008082]|uniref:hypothetical protein n=1 Tax=Achromobacter sp. NPDC008082 TaxID=3363888 RepID=UPI0036E364AD
MPDLATAGAAIVKDYFVKQTTDARTPVLLSSQEDSTLRDQGIAARTFQSRSYLPATRLSIERTLSNVGLTALIW